MTPALLWFSLIIASYGLFTVIWATQHSSLSKPWHLGVTTGNTVLPGKKMQLLGLFVLANAVLVIFPAAVYRFGFWGLLWPVLMALAFVIFRTVSIFSGKKGQVRSFLVGRWATIFKKALVLVGSLWFLSWQLGIMVQFITALSLDGLSVSFLKAAITLFLLVTALLAGEKNLYDYLGSKLLTLCLFCILASVVLFAYIGGVQSFSGHVQNYYGFVDATDRPVFGKMLALWPSLKADLAWEMVLALLLGLFVLALWEEQQGAEHLGQTAKGDNPKAWLGRGKRMPFFAWMAIGLLSLGYIILMGLGSHFTGADGLYLKSYGTQVTVLFDPVPPGSEAVNLPALFLKSLAGIIPSVVGGMTALVTIALLSTGQMLLTRASRLLAADVIVPVLGRLGVLKQDSEWLSYLWQMRFYTLVLIAALVLSEL